MKIYLQCPGRLKTQALTAEYEAKAKWLKGVAEQQSSASTASEFLPNIRLSRKLGLTELGPTVNSYILTRHIWRLIIASRKTTNI